jgi:4-hydroxy-3-polyprenylbenzoate decarboxylase
VAKYISENVDPENDIIFTQGPMDVLDHSCTKMAFGGKMGIDGTKKLEEELRSPISESVKRISNLQKSEITNQFPEINDINDSLLKLGISMVFVSVKKNRKGHLEELNKQLFAHPEFKHVKVVLYLEHTIDISDIADAVWRFSNNVDPRRDSMVVKAINEESISHIGLDGTRKTKEFDGFSRDWPNILASKPETIKHIDEIWDKLGLGEFIPSPSNKYLKQLYKGGAVVEE